VGVLITIWSPFPGDGILDALGQVHILDPDPKRDELLYVGCGHNESSQRAYPIVVAKLVLHHSVFPGN